MTISQMMIEQLSALEYSHLLAYGDPISIDDSIHTDSDALAWISTLDSMTFPDMTFGYHVEPCMSTVV